MTGRLRFHLDENVDPAIADGLRRRGIDVTTTQEMGLLQASDDRQIEFAINQNRVLVTHDDDFLANAKRGISHSGIAYCHPGTRSVGRIIAALALMSDCLSAEEMQNHIEFL
jgi:hypothetical protein